MKRKLLRWMFRSRECREGVGYCRLVCACCLYSTMYVCCAVRISDRPPKRSKGSSQRKSSSISAQDTPTKGGEWKVRLLHFKDGAPTSETDRRYRGSGQRRECLSFRTKSSSCVYGATSCKRESPDYTNDPSHTDRGCRRRHTCRKGWRHLQPRGRA